MVNARASESRAAEIQNPGSRKNITCREDPAPYGGFALFDERISRFNTQLPSPKFLHTIFDFGAGGLEDAPLRTHGLAIDLRVMRFFYEKRNMPVAGSSGPVRVAPALVEPLESVVVFFAEERANIEVALGERDFDIGVAERGFNRPHIVCVDRARADDGFGG